MDMRKRTSFIIIIALILAGAAISALLVVKHQKNQAQQNNSPYPATVARNLTAESRQIYQQRLEAAQNQLGELKKNNVVEAKDFFTAYMQIGAQYYGLGELAKARDYYQQALAQTPGNYNGWVALYTVTLEQGDNQTAKQAILKAAELKPNDPDIWQKYIIMMQERFGAGKEELAGMYKEALAKTNNHIDMIIAYAQFLEQQGDKQGALEQWQQAVALHPDNSAYQQELKRLQQSK
jgi:tetratricopeptide (TPR) repeat protein